MQTVRQPRGLAIPGTKHSVALNSGSPKGWVKSTAVALAAAMQAPTDAPVYAIISTWFEADIIEASVKHCFANGCSRVLLLDNKSPDDTVAVAVAAGAEIGEIYETQFYDDDLRILKQNEIAKRLVAESGASDVWVVSLDADEFLTGLDGEPFATTLRRLPPGIRTAGSSCVDLYPTSPEQYVRGRHPATCMDSGVFRFARVFCHCKHWKHVPLRYTDGVFDIAQHRGNHWCAARDAGVAVAELAGLDMRLIHAPIRNRVDAEARLLALCGKDPKLGGLRRCSGDDDVTGSNGGIKKWRSLDHIYHHRWNLVEYPHSQVFGRSVVGIELYPWAVIYPELAGKIV